MLANTNMKFPVKKTFHEEKPEVFIEESLTDAHFKPQTHCSKEQKRDVLPVSKFLQRLSLFVVTELAVTSDVLHVT